MSRLNDSRSRDSRCQSHKSELCLHTIYSLQPQTYRVKYGMSRTITHRTLTHTDKGWGYTLYVQGYKGEPRYLLIPWVYYSYLLQMAMWLSIISVSYLFLYRVGSFALQTLRLTPPGPPQPLAIVFIEISMMMLLHHISTVAPGLLPAPTLAPACGMKRLTISACKLCASQHPTCGRRRLQVRGL
jgi:hypothetical protein